MGEMDCPIIANQGPAGDHDAPRSIGLKTLRPNQPARHETGELAVAVSRSALGRDGGDVETSDPAVGTLSVDV